MIQKSDQRLSKDGVVNGRDRREEEITKELEETMGEAISEASQVYIYIYVTGIYPRVGKIHWRRKWQPNLLLSEEPHGQRSLARYSP